MGPAVNAVGNSKYFISVILLVPLIGTAFAISLLLQGGIRFSDLALLAAMYIMTGFGLTIGFHRLLTHRSFQSYPAVKIILLILGSMGVAGPPIAWAAALSSIIPGPILKAILTVPWRGYFTRMSDGFSRTDFLMPRYTAPTCLQTRAQFLSIAHFCYGWHYLLQSRS